MFTLLKRNLSNSFNCYTYQNLLPDAIASGSDITGWTEANATITADTNNQLSGDSCYKLTIAVSGGSVYRNILNLLESGCYYAISTTMKNGNLGGSGVRQNVVCVNGVGTLVTSYTLSSTYLRQGIVLQPSDFATATSVRLAFAGSGSNTEYAYLDEVSLQKITQEEYSQGIDAFFTKYPFVLGQKQPNLSNTLLT